MKIRSIATVTPRQAVIIERLYSLSQLAKLSGVRSAATAHHSTKGQK